MADGDRQPFADEVKDDAHFDVASFNPTAGELQDKGHFDPASFESQQAPPAQGGGAEVPFWMRGADESADTSKFADKSIPKDLGKKDNESVGWEKALENATASTNKETDELMRQKTGEERAGFRDIKADMEKLRQRKPLELEKNQAKPEKADFSKNTMEYMQIAALVGAMAGGFGRRGTTTALTAFSGMMKGLHDGDMEVFKQRSEEWKEAEQQVNDINQAKIDEYNAAWKDANTNIDQKMRIMQLVGSKFDDQITYNTAKLNNYTKLAEFHAKMQETHEARVEKAEKSFYDIELLKGRLKDQQAQEQANYDDAAERFVKGDKNARAQAIGRGGASASTNWNAAVGRAAQNLGFSNSDILANQQAYSAQQVELNTIARRGGNVAVAISAFDDAAKLALDANTKSKRSGIAGWNSLLGQYYVQSGDPEYRDLVDKTNTAINIYARIVGGGGAPHVADQEQGHLLLNPSMPPKAYATALNALKQEAAIESRAPGKARQEVRDRTTGAAPNQPQSSGPSPGQVEDGFRFKGGDPSSPSNWEKQ